MSTALKLSVAEFVNMAKCGAFAQINRRIELIRGELREKLIPQGPVHGWLVTALNNWSVKQANSFGMIASCQVPLDLTAQESMPEPDLMWLQKVSYKERHPTWQDVRLAIEVADSSLKSDLTEKAELYAEAGIQEYWVVDAPMKQIHVFRNPVKGVYSTVSVAVEGDLISPEVAADALLSVTQLFQDEL